MRGIALSVQCLEDRLTPVTLAPGFAISQVVGGLAQPTVLVEAPDGRFVIAEQAGVVKVVSADGSQTTAALGLTVDFSGERGLVGLTLDPNFTPTASFTFITPCLPAAAFCTIA